MEGSEGGGCPENATSNMQSLVNHPTGEGFQSLMDTLTGTRYCGVIEIQRTAEELDSLKNLDFGFIDRFGNLYFPGELLRTQPSQNCSSSGYFSLEFVGVFSA